MLQIDACIFIMCLATSGNAYIYIIQIPTIIAGSVFIDSPFELLVDQHKNGVIDTSIN